ncbi:hypothetical protein BGX34_007545 [Mortierella sp. NVP85]|nr:hypothetical protein BGX34_007545 [Mortierella sp. NVP85]
MAFARGPTHTPPPHTPHTPHTPVFRSHQHYHPQQHHHHHPVSSLPSPPLSSVEPPYNGFFLKSPLQERCEALEMELASLKLRLKSPEDSSASKRKESAQGKLQDTQRELCEAKSALALHQELIRRMETTVQEQESKLKEMLAEREALAEDMKESYTMNTKQQKRLKHSTEMIENLQRENQQLIQQLHVLRSTGQGTETPDVQSETSGSVGPSRPQSYHSIFEPDHPGNKAEVERLQDLVLMMGNRHVQVQAQLTFFQQQAQQLQDQLEKTQEAQRNDLAQTTASPPQTPGTPGSSKHGSMFMENSTLSSLLTSVASVASGSPSRRTKPTRRFTVNAPRKDGELTVEQRKCEFLMDQISALQRGYDALRQEKVALELQLDLLERQQHHHQQQQLKYQSRGRAIGKEQSAALSKALAIMVASPTSATANPLSIPSTPLLPTISAAEQEREKARIQFELEQARIQAQKEAEEKEAQRLAAKAAAEEAEREAIRLKRAKSMHLKETLASLEAKRSDSRNVQITHPDELKHLEHLRHLNGEQLSRRSSSSESFHNAAPSRPFGQASCAIYPFHQAPTTLRRSAQWDFYI